MKPAPVVIKKYGNRRLYDSTSSKYINLDDIAGFIREGKDAKEKPTGLPLELLRQLIVASDEARQEFVMWYLKSAFDTYQKVQDAVQSRLGEVQSTILSPVDMMKKFLGAPAAPQPRAAEPDLEALRKRVVELEARLEKGARGKRRKRVKR
jgi:polyhydroxyalkanoate synthesis regulator protein